MKIIEGVQDIHCFIFYNWMLLEEKRTKDNIHNWIDLIFGVGQQSIQKDNLFRPLTDEVLYTSS